MGKHYSVMAMILTNQTPRRALLLENRKAQLWMPPGGHQEANENPLETAIREAKEEAGIDIADFLPKQEPIDEKRSLIPLPARLVEMKIPARGSEPAHYHLDFLYVVRVAKPLDVTTDEREIGGAVWATLDEMADLAIPADILPVLEREMNR